MNREQWLMDAKTEIDQVFFDRDRRRLPKSIQVSTGFARGSKRAIGQCWDSSCCLGNSYQIFICPTRQDPLEILGILLHELIHACVGLKEKHGGRFKQVAKAVGLKGEMKCTTVGKSSRLEKQLALILDVIGEYPHDPMIHLEDEIPRKRVKKPVVKKLTLHSVKDPDYKLTISEELLELGYPLDPWGQELTLE